MRRGSYGLRRTVFIMPQAREPVPLYLEKREEHLKAKGLQESVLLIPRISEGKDGVYSSNHFRKLKKRIQEESGITFRLKDFRSTFASLTVKKNPSLMLDVSKQLGHSSMEITQRFYADIEAFDAGRRLCAAWSTPGAETKRSPKTVLIGQSEYLSGYA